MIHGETLPGAIMNMNDDEMDAVCRQLAPDEAHPPVDLVI